MMNAYRLPSTVPTALTSKLVPLCFSFLAYKIKVTIMLTTQSCGDELMVDKSL